MIRLNSRCEKTHVYEYEMQFDDGAHIKSEMRFEGFADEFCCLLDDLWKEQFGEGLETDADTDEEKMEVFGKAVAALNALHKRVAEGADKQHGGKGRKHD